MPCLITGQPVYPGSAFNHALHNIASAVRQLGGLSALAIDDEEPGPLDALKESVVRDYGAGAWRLLADPAATQDLLNGIQFEAEEAAAALEAAAAEAAAEAAAAMSPEEAARALPAPDDEGTGAEGESSDAAEAPTTLDDTPAGPAAFAHQLLEASAHEIRAAISHVDDAPFLQAARDEEASQDDPRVTVIRALDARLRAIAHNRGADGL